MEVGGGVGLLAHLPFLTNPIVLKNDIGHGLNEAGKKQMCDKRIKSYYRWQFSARLKI